MKKVSINKVLFFYKFIKYLKAQPFLLGLAFKFQKLNSYQIINQILILINLIINLCKNGRVLFDKLYIILVYYLIFN